MKRVKRSLLRWERWRESLSGRMTLVSEGLKSAVKLLGTAAGIRLGRVESNLLLSKKNLSGPQNWKEEFHNGKEYHALQGQNMRLPDYSDRRATTEYLRRHNDNVYRV